MKTFVIHITVYFILKIVKYPHRFGFGTFFEHGLQIVVWALRSPSSIFVSGQILICHSLFQSVSWVMLGCGQPRTLSGARIVTPQRMHLSSIISCDILFRIYSAMIWWGAPYNPITSMTGYRDEFTLKSGRSCLPSPEIKSYKKLNGKWKNIKK